MHTIYYKAGKIIGNKSRKIHVNIMAYLTRLQYC